jgi:hypothetical protein
MLLRCSTLLSQPRQRDLQLINLDPPRPILTLAKCMSHFLTFLLVLILDLLQVHGWR